MFRKTFEYCKPDELKEVGYASSPKTGTLGLADHVLTFWAVTISMYVKGVSKKT